MNMLFIKHFCVGCVVSEIPRVSVTSPYISSIIMRTTIISKNNNYYY